MSKFTKHQLNLSTRLKEEYGYDYDSKLLSFQKKFELMTQKMDKINDIKHQASQELINCTQNYKANWAANNKILVEKAELITKSKKGDFPQHLINFQDSYLSSSNQGDLYISNYNTIINNIFPNIPDSPLSILIDSPERIIHALYMFM